MAANSYDSFFDLELNGDQTQVFATIHPPRGGGRQTTVDEVTTRLKQMGVMYGVREGEIARTIAQVASSHAPAVRVLVAQGVLPIDGADAQVQWKIPHDSAAHPLPRGATGEPDYFSVAPERIVKAGQVIATVKAAMPGSPGKTLTAPYRVIPVATPRDVPYTAGRGVSLSSDRQQFTAEVSGVVEIDSTSIVVHAVEWVTGDLSGATREFSGGVAIQGDITASVIHAEGPISVSGTVAGCTLRAKGDVVVNRCARTRILADGDVFVLGKLLHCQVVTPKRVVAGEGTLLLGGNIVATLGIQADNVGGAGSGDGAGTFLAAATDRFTPYRQQEVEAEIAKHEENINKIARALRPLSSSNPEGVPEQKRQLVQTLVAQRRNLEERIRELHHEKRSLILASKSRVDAEICITGTIYRGVTLQLDNAVATLEESKSALRFGLDSFRDAVIIKPLEEALAA